MTFPRDEDVQIALLHLLDQANDGQMHCSDVYRELAKQFPMLTHDEMAIPYRRSASHWANRVQWARSHAVRNGWLMKPAGGSRGYWKISPAGRKLMHDATVALEELNIL